MRTFPIIDRLFTRSDCFKSQKPCSRTGIQVHSVGCKGTTVDRWEKSWNRPRRLTCGGYVIDLNGIYRTLRDGQKCWLSGSWIKGNANKDYLGFEICEPRVDTPESTADLYAKTLYLCVYLCRLYGINPAKVQTHCELRRLGLASNHADVKHWWGKKGTPWEPYTMDRLRSDIAVEIGVPIRYCTEIKRGYVGDAARFAQTVLVKSGLNVAIDGVYGYKTVNAVRAFQKANGLKADGICGPITWNVIYQRA